MKKTVLSILSLLIAVSLLLSACVKSDSGDKGVGDVTLQTSATEDEFVSEDPNVNPPGQLPIVKDKIKLTALISLGQSNITSFDDNDFTQWLEEQTNIDLSFESIPVSESKPQFQIMVASGMDLPDIVLGIFFLDDMPVYQYGKEGVFIPLNHYYENYGYWSNIMLEKASNTMLKQLMTSPDGNMYYVPDYVEQSGNEWSMRAWINNVWLENLGLSIPTTTDDFYNVLKAFKTGDPNGNMLEDEIPFSGSDGGWRRRPWDWLFNAFVYNDTIDRYIVNNGKVDVAYRQNEWRDALIYMNRLFQEGLFDNNCLSYNAGQLVQAVRGGDSWVPTVGAYTSGGPLGVFKDLTLFEEVPLPPLKGPNGVQNAAYFPSMPKAVFSITKYCKHPLAAFRLADFMLSEEASIRSRFGTPGKHWFDPEPGDVGLYEETMGIKARLKVAPSDPDNPDLFVNKDWSQANPCFRTFAIMDGQVWNEDPNSGEYKISKAVPLYIGKRPDEIVYKLIFTEEEADEIADLKNNINTYVNQCIKAFITGEMRIDSEWEIYLNELDKLGLQRYLDIAQQVYDRMSK